MCFVKIPLLDLYVNEQERLTRGGYDMCHPVPGKAANDELRQL